MTYTKATHLTEWIETARRAMEVEGNAILSAASRLDDNLARAATLILNRPGKLIITGIGKSGHVARKLVSTMCSTGTPAAFLHAAEAAHGDLGLYGQGDPTLMISRSGATCELLRLTSFLREIESPCIGIIGVRNSPLGEHMDVLLDASVEREADRNNLAPTASSLVALALGHALAVALMEARNFTPDEFERFHPAGSLGRGLRLRVRELMHAAGEVAWVLPGDPLKQVVIAMTLHPLGAACVAGPGRTLLGLITDGDVRRALQQHDDIRPLRASHVMTTTPVTIGPDARLQDALRLMEDRSSQISLLPVVETAENRCVGLIRLHDVYQGFRRAEQKQPLNLNP